MLEQVEVDMYIFGRIKRCRSSVLRNRSKDAAVTECAPSVRRRGGRGTGKVCLRDTSTILSNIPVWSSESAARS